MLTFWIDWFWSRNVLQMFTLFHLLRLFDFSDLMQCGEFLFCMSAKTVAIHYIDHRDFVFVIRQIAVGSARNACRIIIAFIAFHALPVWGRRKLALLTRMHSITVGYDGLIYLQEFVNFQIQELINFIKTQPIRATCECFFRCKTFL